MTTNIIPKITPSQANTPSGSSEKMRQKEVSDSQGIYTSRSLMLRLSPCSENNCFENYHMENYRTPPYRRF